MKLLCTIRLDPSDTFIFPLAAEPGEWAISVPSPFATLDKMLRMKPQNLLTGLPVRHLEATI